VNGRIDLLTCAGSQDVYPGGHQTPDDLGYLVVALSFAVDDLRDTLPDGAVVIQCGEAQLFVRKTPEFFQALGDREGTFAYILQDFFECIVLHLYVGTRVPTQKASLSDLPALAVRQAGGRQVPPVL